MKTVLKLLKSRRSTVLFSVKKIDSDCIENLFEAARWAPSSMNEQPWRFIYSTRDDTSFNDFLNCLHENNKEWAQHAYMLLITVAHTISDYNKKENPYAIHDTAMAFAYLTIQALSSGLSVHPMGGFSKEKVAQIALIPRSYIPLVVAAIGYKSESKKFPDHLERRESSPRQRNQIREIAFRNHFEV